jgi:hypothetical protein
MQIIQQPKWEMIKTLLFLEKKKENDMEERAGKLEIYKIVIKYLKVIGLKLDL